MATFTLVNQDKAVRASIRLPKLPPESRNFSKKKYGTITEARSEAKRWAATREGELRNSSPGAAVAAHDRTFQDAADAFCQVRCGFRLDGNTPKEALAIFTEDQSNACTPMGNRQPILGSNMFGPVGQLDYWVTYFGNTRLSKITTDKINHGLRALEMGSKGKAGRKRSPATINRYQSAIRSALELCLVTNGLFPWLQYNPAPTMKRQEKNKRKVVLTGVQRKALLKNCLNSQWDDLYAVVQIGIATGARQSNIMGLRWSRIDLETGRVDIPGDEMKNGRDFATWITGDALDLLRRMNKQLKLQKVTKLHDENSDLVFPAPKSAGPQAFDSKRRIAWNRALEQSGIEHSIDASDRENTGFRFHDLRHTFAKMVGAKGASNQQLKQMLGVSSDSIVARYTNIDIDDVKNLY